MLKRSIDEIAGKKPSLFRKLIYRWNDLWRYTSPFSNIREFYYHMKHRLFDRYDLIRTGLDPSEYYDKPHLMLYGNMNLLVDYVEKEKCFEIVAFSDKEKTSIMEIYNWWKNYETRKKQINLALDNWHDSRFPDKNMKSIDAIRKTKETDISRYYSNVMSELEEDLAKEEQEMLHKLMDIRNTLWT